MKQSENKNCLLGTKHSHNDACKFSLLRNREGSPIQSRRHLADLQ